MRYTSTAIKEKGCQEKKTTTKNCENIFFLYGKKYLWSKSLKKKVFSALKPAENIGVIVSEVLENGIKKGK